jgi:hypothetical protein
MSANSDSRHFVCSEIIMSTIDSIYYRDAGAIATESLSIREQPHSAR